MTPAPPVTLTLATAAEAAFVADLLSSVAELLTVQYGMGHWSHATSERGVLFAMRSARVYLAKADGRPVATLALTTKKPWAIDTVYFTPRPQPLYLLSMAVDPRRQRTGIGRACVDEALDFARNWPADAWRP